MKLLKNNPHVHLGGPTLTHDMHRTHHAVRCGYRDFEAKRKGLTRRNFRPLRIENNPDGSYSVFEFIHELSPEEATECELWYVVWFFLDRIDWTGANPPNYNQKDT